MEPEQTDERAPFASCDMLATPGPERLPYIAIVCIGFPLKYPPERLRLFQGRLFWFSRKTISFAMDQFSGAQPQSPESVRSVQ